MGDVWHVQIKTYLDVLHSVLLISTPVSAALRTFRLYVVFRRACRTPLLAKFLYFQKLGFKYDEFNRKGGSIKNALSRCMYRIYFILPICDQPCSNYWKTAYSNSARTSLGRCNWVQTFDNLDQADIYHGSFKATNPASIPAGTGHGCISEWSA